MAIGIWEKIYTILLMEPNVEVKSINFDEAQNTKYNSYLGAYNHIVEHLTLMGQ